MANSEWDSATVEKKLDMLRADIKQISDHHNALSQDFRQQSLIFLQEIKEIKEIKDSLPKT